MPKIFLQQAPHQPPSIKNRTQRSARASHRTRRIIHPLSRSHRAYAHARARAATAGTYAAAAAGNIITPVVFSVNCHYRRNLVKPERVLSCVRVCICVSRDATGERRVLTHIGAHAEEEDGPS